MSAPNTPDPMAFLEGGGAMGELIRSHNWSATPLGSIVQWPAELRVLTATLLRSQQPMALHWGVEGVMIYNEAYADLSGDRHPSILGKPVIEAWPELAELKAQVLEVVLAGETMEYRDRYMQLCRHGGIIEDFWISCSYSPVVDEHGVPRGVLAVLQNTTARMEMAERLRIAQQAGGVGSFEWFPEDGRLVVSEEYRRIWGLAPGVEVTNEMLLRKLHPEDIRHTGMARDSDGNPLEYAEYRLLDAKPGEARWLARRGEVISMDDGRAGRFVGVVFDITERKRIEQEVTVNQTRWRALFEHMQEDFFVGEAVRDAKGVLIDFSIVEANPAFERRTGLNLKQILGRRVREVLLSIDDGLVLLCAKALETGESIQFETQVPALNNRWFEARVRPSSGDRIAVMFVDITARKVIELSTRESEERFRNLAQVMPCHVWTASPDGMSDWFNDRVYSYAGVAEGSLDNDAWMSLVHPDDVDAVAAIWAKAVRTRHEYQAEYRLRRFDGVYRWHIVHAVPMRDAAGVVQRWIGNNMDIHDQKTAEAALVQLTNTLEERVAQRSEELLEATNALRQSQKMESIGNLSGGIAHDFNNLLQVISGNLQLLADEVNGNALIQQRIGHAMAGVSRGSRLASQLLAFGRRQPLAPKVLNLGRLIRDMDDLLTRALGEAVKVETVIASGLWNTLVDPGNVENALLNLAINGRDAMDGHGRLTIEASNASLDQDYVRHQGDLVAGEYVMLTVTDTGHGMDTATVEKVFEPFFTTKSEGLGTGLGLSMVYGFVKQSGGHIRVYSELGQGTTIRLYLPRSTTAEQALDSKIDNTPVVGGNETILVVEDDDAVRATVISLLEDLGYRVLEAAGPQDAQSLIQRGTVFDLLFTDIVMPGSVKSTELAHQAKQKFPGAAVLFTSGYAESAIVHGGRLDDGVELLSKPYTRELLARRLRQLLDQRKTPVTGTIATTPEPVPASTRPVARPKLAQTTQPLCILVCEDEWMIRSMLADMLEARGHRVHEAADANEATALHDQHEIDLLITDVGLPGTSGVALVECLRATSPELQVIFATGEESIPGVQLNQVTRMLTKPFSSEALLNLVTELGAQSPQDRSQLA